MFFKGSYVFTETCVRRVARSLRFLNSFHSSVFRFCSVDRFFTFGGVGFFWTAVTSIPLCPRRMILFLFQNARGPLTNPPPTRFVRDSFSRTSGSPLFSFKSQFPGVAPLTPPQASPQTFSDQFYLRPPPAFLFFFLAPCTCIDACLASTFALVSSRCAAFRCLFELVRNVSTPTAVGLSVVPVLCEWEFPPLLLACEGPHIPRPFRSVRFSPTLFCWSPPLSPSFSYSLCPSLSFLHCFCLMR